MNPTVEFKVHFGRSERGKLEMREGTSPPPSSQGRIPRVARLMALAIHLEGLVRDGKVRDYADLARLGHVTRARITQVLNLLALAPDIQEAVLLLPPTIDGRHPISEHDLRPIAAMTRWSVQRRAWNLVLRPIDDSIRLGRRVDIRRYGA